MNKLACSALAFATLLHVSCTSSESDGREYYSNASPLQGKMGTTFKRVRSTIPPVTANVASEPLPPDAGTPAAVAPPAEKPEGLLGRFVTSEGPPGLLDRFDKPDEPGAEYWMHGQQSPNPVQSKMGVRVTRRKK